MALLPLPVGLALAASFAHVAGPESAPESALESAIAQEDAAQAAEATQGLPRLIVMISVDQLIPEQLERLGPYMKGGLGRLIREGAVFERAELPYARTETGAGHVTLSTGCLPRSHGVVGNEFWDRASGKRTYCVEDPLASLVTGSGVVEGTGQRSPRTLLRPTLGQILQRLDPESKVVSISAKDRAAIGMCGAAKGVAIWWDKSRSAGFVTSTAYGVDLPPAVTEFNATWMKRLRSEPWIDSSPLELVDGDPARWGTAPDDRPGETPMGAAGVTFPYEIPAGFPEDSLGKYAYATPFVDGYVGIMGERLTRAMSLGQDDHPDLLALSFSGCDVVGHASGPYSREVTDLVFRLDRSLGSLFDRLDESVGRGRWVAALTADHGVLPLPEYLVAKGEDARRVPGPEVAAFRAAVRQGLRERLGANVKERSGPGGYYVDPKSLVETGVDEETARRAMAQVIRDLRPRFPWVDDAYAYDEIAEFGPDQMGVRKALYHSFHPDRTIDVVVIHAPGVLVGRAKGTSHGSPHGYDRRIPMILYGPGFPAGRDRRPTGSQDIVPSLLGSSGTKGGVQFDGRDLFPD